MILNQQFTAPAWQQRKLELFLIGSVYKSFLLENNLCSRSLWLLLVLCKLGYRFVSLVTKLQRIQGKNNYS